MFGIAPASLVPGDVSCGTVFERHRLCRVELRLPTFGPSLLDWIDAIVSLHSVLGRSVASISQSYRMQCSHSHPTGTAIQHEPKHPILRAIVGDAQIEPAAIGSHAGPLCALHLKRGEPADCSRHFSPRSCPHSSCGLWRTAMNV